MKPLERLIRAGVYALERPMPTDGICQHHGVYVGRVGLFSVTLANVGPRLQLMIYARNGYPDDGFSGRVFDVIRSEVTRAVGPIDHDWNGVAGSNGISVVATSDCPSSLVDAIARYYALPDVFTAHRQPGWIAFQSAFNRNLTKAYRKFQIEATE